MSEFGVYGAEHVGGLGSVVGRCYCGRLHVGSVFLRLNSPANTLAKVRFVVTRIEAYGRDLIEIDEGLTARLHLDGDGWTLVEHGCVLETDDGEDPPPINDARA